MTDLIIKYSTLDRLRRILTLLLIIIQSIGIRFFEGQGSVLLVIIIILSARGILLLKQKDILNILLICFVLTCLKFLTPAFQTSAFFFQLLLIISVYIFLVQYRNKISLLISEFTICLKLLFIHSLIGYILAIIIPDAFILVRFSELNYKTFLYIFYVSELKFGNIYRNTGLLWEPGLLQLVLNLYLFYCIISGQSKLMLGAVVLTIISTNSTTGFVILGLNLIFYIYQFSKSIKQAFIALVSLALTSVAILSYVQSNFEDKLNNTNTSSLARLQDFEIGISLINESPLWGHGIFEKKYLESKTYSGVIESALFTNEYLESSGDLSGGYTNGLLSLFAWYGIPLALFLLYLMYHNRLVEENISRVLFFMILCITYFSEPITYTSFFLLFPLSTVVLSRSYQYLSTTQNQKVV